MQLYFPLLTSLFFYRFLSGQPLLEQPLTQQTNTTILCRSHIYGTPPELQLTALDNGVVTTLETLASFEIQSTLYG